MVPGNHQGDSTPNVRECCSQTFLQDFRAQLTHAAYGIQFSLGIACHSQNVSPKTGRKLKANLDWPQETQGPRAAGKISSGGDRPKLTKKETGAKNFVLPPLPKTAKGGGCARLTKTVQTWFPGFLDPCEKNKLKSLPDPGALRDVAHITYRVAFRSLSLVHRLSRGLHPQIRIPARLPH